MKELTACTRGAIYFFVPIVILRETDGIIPSGVSLFRLASSFPRSTEVI